MENSKNDSSEIQVKKWQTKMFWLMWVTYASFYLVRVNISVALPGIMEEFGLTKTNMGMVLSSLFIMYAIGQFINGQLGDKLNSRKIITIGLLSSAILNVLFGFTGGVIGFMMVIWGLNGYVQSMGWGPTVKAAASWFPRKIRAKISGRLGTCYVLGGALSWLLAGYIISQYNWRYTFWIPSIIVAAVAINWYVRARNSPEEIGLPSVEDQEKGIESTKIVKDKHIGFKETLRLTLGNSVVWYAAMALFGLNIVRYGFMDWAPTYMFEEQGAHISIAAYKAMAFPIAGGLGAIFAGWVADKFFNSRKAPISFIMLTLLALFCYLYRIVPGESWELSLVILLIIGFLTFGPHVLIVAAIPMDLGNRKATSSVTGFIDSMGYVGASLTGIGTGYLVDNFSWDSAFYFWIFGAVFAAIMILFVWKHELKKESITNII